MTDKFTYSGRASVIIDGQFGSTGKGLIAAYLAQRNHCDVATTNASANAGHTTIIGDRKFVTYHLPTFGVVNENCSIYLNAGAIIDPDLLLREIEEVGVDKSRIKISPRAGIIHPMHKEMENGSLSSTTGLASTQKGVGAALADKVLRKKGAVAADNEMLKDLGLVGGSPIDDELRRGARVVIEVPQGFSLGLNSGLAYPYCTSREVSVAQALSDAMLHPRYLGPVMMTARTFPIRVGNIYDDDGNQIGWSGPCYRDQVELKWESLGLEPELTTVTKRPRRIFSWSTMQYELACRINKPDFVFLNFVNYLKSWGQFRTIVDLMGDHGAHATHLGLGPDVADIVEDWGSVAERMGWTIQ